MENQLEHLQNCLNALIDKFNALHADNGSLTDRIKVLEQEKAQLNTDYSTRMDIQQQSHSEQLSGLQNHFNDEINELKVENTVLRSTLIDTADTIKSLMSRLPEVAQEEVEQ